MATPASPTARSTFDWNKILAEKFLGSVRNLFSKDASGSFTGQSQPGEDDGKISFSRSQLAGNSSWRNSEVLSPENVRNYLSYNGSKTSKDTCPVHYFTGTNVDGELMPIHLHDAEVLKNQQAQIVMEQQDQGYDMLKEIGKRNPLLYCLVLLRSISCI